MKNKKIITMVAVVVMLISVVIIVAVTARHKHKEVILALSEDEKYHERICSYLEENVFSTWTVSSNDDRYAPVCEYIFLDADNRHIYVFAGGADYGVNADGIVIRTTACMLPVRLSYRYSNGNLYIEDFFYPSDGSDYSQDVKQGFSTKARSKLSALTNDERMSLEERAFCRACNMLNVEYAPGKYISGDDEKKY